MCNFLSLDLLDTEVILQLVQRALHFKKNIKEAPKFSDVYVSNLFYENSTRTKLSFQMAQKHLEMQEILFDISTSSVKKGESLYDTVKTLEAIGVGAVVIRHGDKEYYKQLEGVSIPIINGGDGSADHPSQSLLDLMTIYEEFGKFDGLKVCIAGDITHSRVAHSNASVLKRLGAKVVYSAPDEFKDENGDYAKLDECVKDMDIVMLLRLQLERHESNYDKENYLSQYGLSIERADKMKSSAIIMHPAPINRGVEIDDSLVESSKSRIFKQMQNGTYARMAIMEYVLAKGA